MFIFLRIAKGIRMKLYIKTYLNGFIGAIIGTSILIMISYLFLIYFPKIDSMGYLNVLIAIISGLASIGGLIFIFSLLKKMRRLKYFLGNGIHTKAMITQPYSLRIHRTFEELLKQEDESPNTIFSRSIQYQFQTERGETITIDEDNVEGILQHLCIGSKIHILYDPDREEKPLICPWWDTWIANYELDNYPRFLNDATISPLIGKQRHISLFHFFSLCPVLMTIGALLAIGITFFIQIILCNIQGFPENIPNWFYFIGYGIGFLLLAFAYIALKMEQNFYEYAVLAAALVTYAQLEKRTIVKKLKSRSGNKNYIENYPVFVIKYKYLSSTKDNIFQGYCEVQDILQNRQLKQGASINILYHAQRPYESRIFTHKDEEYIH